MLPRWKADLVLRVWELMRYVKSCEISCLKAWPNLSSFFHEIQFRDQNRAFHTSDGIYITHILNILPKLHMLDIIYLYIYMTISISVCSSVLWWSWETIYWDNIKCKNFIWGTSNGTSNSFPQRLHAVRLLDGFIELSQALCSWSKE